MVDGSAPDPLRGVHRCHRRLDAEDLRAHRLIGQHDLRATNQVRQFAGDRLQLRVDRVGDFRDEAACRDIDEVVIVHAADIHGHRIACQERLDRVRDVFRKTESRREIVPRTQRDHAERHLRQALLESRDAVQDLVERPVAAPDEEVVVAVEHRLLGGTGRVAFGGRDDDVQEAHAFTELAIDRRQEIRCGISSRNRVNDELRLHAVIRLQNSSPLAIDFPFPPSRSPCADRRGPLAERDTIARGLRIIPSAQRLRRATARRSPPTSRRASRHPGRVTCDRS